MAANWLAPIRKSDPKNSLFLRKDQSPGTLCWWVQQWNSQFPLRSRGLCSVNMAAAGVYTVGGAFWEFGARLDRTGTVCLCGRGS